MCLIVLITLSSNRLSFLSCRLKCKVASVVPFLSVYLLVILQASEHVLLVIMSLSTFQPQLFHAMALPNNIFSILLTLINLLFSNLSLHLHKHCSICLFELSLKHKYWLDFISTRLTLVCAEVPFLVSLNLTNQLESLILLKTVCMSSHQRNIIFLYAYLLFSLYLLPVLSEYVTHLYFCQWITSTISLFFVCYLLFLIFSINFVNFHVSQPYIIAEIINYVGKLLFTFVGISEKIYRSYLCIQIVYSFKYIASIKRFGFHSLAYQNIRNK